MNLKHRVIFHRLTSHEASVKQHGATEARIFDAIRLVAAYKSLAVLL